VGGQAIGAPSVDGAGSALFSFSLFFSKNRSAVGLQDKRCRTKAAASCTDSGAGNYGFATGQTAEAPCTAFRSAPLVSSADAQRL
jgi:hypothetical protein